MKQAPHKEWTYREIECHLYKHQKPDGVVWAGYVKVGDEWHDAVKNDRVDESKVVALVEKKVDKILRTVLEDQEPNRHDPLGPVCPEPIPDPKIDPWDPTPEPVKPIWQDGPDKIITNSNKNGPSDCESCKELRKGTSWIGGPPKCPKHRDNGSFETYLDSNTTTTSSMSGTLW